MIQLDITMTSVRGFSKSDKWQCYGDQIKTFEDMKAAKDWLKQTYGNHKRVPMYRDIPGGAEQVGWIYSFKDYQYEEGKRFHFFEQHWVEFYRMEHVNPSQR